MLVLTRKRSESIKIGNDIVIKVIQTSRGTVKLGIEAPADVRVLRAELAEFAAVPAVAVMAGSAVGESADSSEADADVEVELVFDTEYAVELQDQMLCLAR